MLELGRRERHMLGGLLLQVALVALMVFAYTQAFRQLKYHRELHDQLTEQVATAKLRAASGAPDVEPLRQQVLELESRLASPQQVQAWVEAAERLARERFSFQKLSVTAAAEPARVFDIQLSDRTASAQVQLIPVDLTAETTTRNAAGFLAAAEQLGPALITPLEKISIEGQPALQMPVKVRLRWLVAVDPAKTGAAPLKTSSSAQKTLDWGWREEPFSSVLASPRSVKLPPELVGRFKLSGILWDPEVPTCVVNGAVLKPGDPIQGYKVVLITPKAVLLEGPDGEISLPLP